MPREYKSFRVTLATGSIGANIHGIDLAKPVSDLAIQEIRTALLDHQVIFFREQSRMTPEVQLAFGQRFGPLHMHPTVPHLEGYPGVMVIHADENSKGHFGPQWHSDVSCDVEPPMGTILQIHTPPPFGGDTLFANMYAAYDDLSKPMKKFLQGLTARHIYPWPNQDGAPQTDQPVIRTHPETGRHVLYVSRLFTRYINGLTAAESQALLNLLITHIDNPYYHVRLKWEKNDVAFWDNRCTQHLAIWDYKPHTRTGHRVTVLGDKPFFRDSGE
jgi:taurine dioxygenase